MNASIKGPRSLIAVSVTCAAMVCIVAVSGCFSISRYESTVRPDRIKPSASVDGKYRLDRVYINHESAISGNEEDYVTGRWILHEKDNYGKTNKSDYEQLRAFYIQEELKTNNWSTQIHSMEDPKVFMDFANKFGNKYPELRGEVLQKTREYQAAEEIGDFEQKAECISNVVYTYVGWSAVRRSADGWKKSFEQQTNLRMFGYENMRVYFEKGFRDDFRALARYGKNNACAKLYFDAVQSALLKNYPGVFTTASDATPLTVLITFKNKYEDSHNYAGLFYGLGFPMTQEVEVEYNVRIIPDAGDATKEYLWNEYDNSQFAWPPDAQNGGAVRRRERWTSMVLPFSLIGIPGESDWPKERKWFTSRGMLSKEDEYKSMKDAKPREYLEEYMFDPVSDGDIIAALIMRSLNKMAEME